MWTFRYSARFPNSKMAFANSSALKTPTALEQLLEEINFQRTKEMRQLLKDGKRLFFSIISQQLICSLDSGFVMLQGTTYWTDLFVRHFLFQNDSTIDCDDLLFFVRKKHVKGSPRYLPKFEVNLIESRCVSCFSSRRILVQLRILPKLFVWWKAHFIQQLLVSREFYEETAIFNKIHFIPFTFFWTFFYFQYFFDNQSI